ncbi:hypothetical protein GIY62_35255 (plasmid) [Burkholderia plantarii]|uniref:hypothetical protein n=1 Tax=Burkholderia plantarii TaxID=41899 RepID=UPI0027298B8D|nr:hypothetical protein [Burkholderia plantarii]WLE64122.1 hypothetical protein GIY62_35255 [Burkholderia plantarii]
MDYILATFFAVMAAAVYSAFALFINAGGRRPAYRIVMWVYIATLFAADVATVTLNLPSGYVIFGSLISGIMGVFTQIAIAVKLGHLIAIDSPYPTDWSIFDRLRSTPADIRNPGNPSYFGPNDPLRPR